MRLKQKMPLVCLYAGSVGLLMAQTTALTNVSAANSGAIVAPDSIVSGWGTGLATTTTSANPSTAGNVVTLPTTLGNVQLSLKDSSNATLQPTLYMVSAGQINYVLPASAALGMGTVSIAGSATTGPVLISNVAPAVFTLDGNTASIPAAQLVRANGSGIVSVIPVFDSGAGGTVTQHQLAINGAGGDSFYLMLYATGVRRKSLNPATATIGGVAVPVTYAGAQSQFPGFDQINIGPLPDSLVGKGLVDLIIRVDGIPANTVKLNFQ